MFTECVVSVQWGRSMQSGKEKKEVHGIRTHQFSPFTVKMIFPFLILEHSGFQHSLGLTHEK